MGSISNLFDFNGNKIYIKIFVNIESIIKLHIYPISFGDKRLGKVLSFEKHLRATIKYRNLLCV